jgi:hypothetical protein
MKVKTKAILNNQEVEVEIDLNDISDEVKSFAEIELDMIDEDDCDECDCGDDFEIEDLSDYSDSTLISECEHRSIPIMGLNTSRTSLIDSMFLSKLMGNYHRLSLKDRDKIEKVIDSL